MDHDQNLKNGCYPDLGMDILIEDLNLLQYRIWINLDLLLKYNFYSDININILEVYIIWKFKIWCYPYFRYEISLKI